ncbi:MAG: AMP-binding protein [Pirellulales bacterium]|nr:AMP-binding protein [Pirellulales bacterium]
MVDSLCQTVPELLAWRARQSPHAPACHERETSGAWRSYTWEELASQVALSAAGMAELGLHGRRETLRRPVVAVAGRTSYTWWVIELAAYHCGCVVAGIDPRLPHDEILKLLRGLCPLAVFTDDERLRDTLDLHFAYHRLAPRWLPRTGSRAWLVLHAGNGRPWSHAAGADAREILSDDGTSGADWQLGDTVPQAAPPAANVPTASCLTACDTTAEACDTEPQPLIPPPIPTPQSPATLLFTSGTSGPPKALLFRHEQLLLACRSIAQAFPDLGPDDTTLCWLPMAHLFQRVMNLLAVSVGGSVYFEPETAQIARSVHEVEPTIFIGVPKFYERLHAAFEQRMASAPWWQRRLVSWALARHAGRFRRAARRGPGGWIDRWLDRHALAPVRNALGRRLRFAITGSAPTPLWLLEFFEQLGILLLEAYGISENSVPLAANRPDAFCFGSVGLPLAGNEIRISAEGEVQVRGGGMCAGYVHMPALQPAQPPQMPVTPDGFLCTGDCGWFDEQGFLHLQGRLNELVKISTGRWLSPARMEQRYLTSPYIEQVVVFADGREPPVALIYPSQAARERAQQAAGHGQTAAADALRSLISAELERLEADLAAHERVARFALLDEPLSVAAGELTLLFKPRRAEIARRHAVRLAELGFVPKVREACASALR